MQTSGKTDIFVSMQEEPVVNPWLGEQIEKLLSEISEEDLRGRYEASKEADPEKTWEDFLCEEALKEKIKAQPALLEKREDFDLPESVRDRLEINSVRVLADLAQLTRETIDHIPGFTQGERDALYAFMEKKGIPARSSSKPVFMVFYSTPEEQQEKVLTYIDIFIHEATELLDYPKDCSLEEAIERACRLYDQALEVAREEKVDLVHYERYVRGYAKILTEYYQFGDEYKEKAEKYVLEDITLCEKIFGPSHEETGLAHRRAGSFLSLIEKYAEAAGEFLSSADIVKALKGDYDSTAGEDLEFAAYCYEEMGMYPLALDLYRQALDISLMHLGNNDIHPRPIMYEISMLYYKMGDRESSNEWMDRYDSFPE